MASASRSSSGNRVLVVEGNDSVQIKNPLLITEIADKVLDYLGASKISDDLEAAFDVCQLWRSLVPAVNIRHRSTPARAPVLIKEGLNDLDIAAIKKYLAFIQKYPSLKASKFRFRNTNLDSKLVSELLAQNGAEMEELELHYRNMNGFTARGLDELLAKKAPNLKTLTITNTVALLPWRALQSVTPPIPVLKLTRIKIDFSPASDGSDDDDDVVTLFNPSDFFRTLFTASPLLEELEIGNLFGSWPYYNTDYNVAMVMNVLISQNGTGNFLGQLKSLVLDHVDPRWLNLLAETETEGRLRLNKFALQRPVLRLNDNFTLYRSRLQVDSTLVQRFMAQQAETLTYLELPLDELRPAFLTLPPMPNLVQLKLQHQGNTDEAVFLGVLNYTINFPRLKLLRLGRQLRNFVADEIYPDPDDLVVGPSTPASATSVQVLQEIPVGVDRALMARIGRLFPNLSKIRARIPYEHEELLVSIWEFCPKVTELFLIFDPNRRRCAGAESDGGDGDPNQGTNTKRRGLDSLFSGIPEEECERLRGLPREELMLMVPNTSSSKSRSLLNLTKLARLAIDVDLRRASPGGAGGHHDNDHDNDHGNDNGNDVGAKLSDVFAYATLVAASQLAYFLARIDQPVGVMVSPSTETVNYVCSWSGLEKVDMECVCTLCTGPGSAKFLRLIRPGTGILESFGSKPIPMDW